MLASRKLRILFLCTGNSCRSQMAEAWTRVLKASMFEPWSAGILAKGLDHRAALVMAEEGIDISNQKSKDIDDLNDLEFDYVVTVCDNARQTCPYFPGKAKVVHYGFDDPPALAMEAESEEEALALYRRVRDEIREFVRSLPDSLF